MTSATGAGSLTPVRKSSASIASAVVVTGATVVVVVLVWIEGIQETPAGEVPPRHREVVGQVDTFEDTRGT